VDSDHPSGERRGGRGATLTVGGTGRAKLLVWRQKKKRGGDDRSFRHELDEDITSPKNTGNVGGRIISDPRPACRTYHGARRDSQ
jgi:hypothetical protein